MPKYYHVHRSYKSSLIETTVIEDQPLFFTKKNSFWYDTEIMMSKDKDYYDGYTIYEITIPKSQFTESFNPIKKNKILKIKDPIQYAITGAEGIIWDFSKFKPRIRVYDIHKN